MSNVIRKIFTDDAGPAVIEYTCVAILISVAVMAGAKFGDTLHREVIEIRCALN